MRVAYGAAVQVQPSTFIRQAAFRKTRGFNRLNRSNWDGELLVDLFPSGATIGICDEFLSCYRLHELSITNSGRLRELTKVWDRRRLERLMERKASPTDEVIAQIPRVWKHATHPVALVERLRHGPIYRRGMK